jgi:hypothetical protein
MTSITLGSNLRIIMAVLATWRVTHLLAHEDGPGDIVVRLRIWLGDRFVGRLMDCFLCLSLWIAIPAATLLTREPADWLLIWWAISGAACLLELTSRARTVNEPGARELQGEPEHVLWSETRRPAE